jgi:hypothetical protein
MTPIKKSDLLTQSSKPALGGDALNEHRIIDRRP